MILSGELKPGDKLPTERELADEMNIHKKINQTKENINQIRFKLHEAEEKLGKAQANSDEKGRTSESLKLAYDNAKTEYEKANYTYTQSNSICNQLSKVFYKLNYEATEVIIIKLIMIQPNQHMIQSFMNLVN